jgi:hypothetical protein
VAEKVEAVYLVEDVKLSNVGVWTKTVFFGKFHGKLGIFPQLSNIFFSNWKCANCVEFFPCCVDFGVRLPRVSVRRGVLWFEEAAVCLSYEGRDVGFIEYWGF